MTASGRGGLSCKMCAHIPENSTFKKCSESRFAPLLKEKKRKEKQIPSWYIKSIDFPCIVKITKKPNEEASQYTKLSSKECHGQEEGEKWRGMINNQIVYWSLSWNSLSCTAQGQLRRSSSGAILLSAALSKCRERMGKKYKRAGANGRAN